MILIKKNEKKFFNKKDNIFESNFYIGELESPDDFSVDSNNKKIEQIKDEIISLIDENTPLNILKKKTETIKILKSYTKKIYISFEQIDKELDGLFRIEKEHILDFGEKIKIEKKSFIILEIKNQCDIQDIRKNILHKKKILSKLGINLDKVYNIVVLKSEPNLGVKNNGTVNVSQAIKNYLKQKIIILYPKDLKLLEDNILSSKNTLNNNVNKIDNKIENLKNEMEKLFKESFNQFKKEIEEIINKNN